MKKIILIALIALFAKASNAQSAAAEKNYALAKDTSAELKSFSAKYNSGKVYLKWTVTGQRNDGVIVVFRSYDNKNFEVIGYKEGVGIPVANDISYFFTDESALQKTTYYKILHIGKSPNYFFSSAISVLLTPAEVCQTK